MSRFLIAFVVLAIAAYGGRAALEDSADGGAGQRARVVGVVDGDTIKVLIGSRRETVRLLGIDTPESVHPGTPVECGARAAARALRRRALTADGRGRSVSLRSDPTQDRRDRYGRLIAYVDLVAGGDLGEALVRDGWAEVYVYRGRSFARLDRYRRASAEARQARLGVWRSCAGF